MHPYQNHRQNTVEKRRVKVLMKSGGYASGGAAHGPGCNCARCRGGKVATGGRINGFADGGKVVQSEAAPARLDKRARGGGIHQITPSKRKPHTNINIINVGHKLRPRPVVPPIGGAIPAVGGPPVAPMGGLPMRAKGGGVTKPAPMWGGGKYGGTTNGPGRLAMTRKIRKDYP